MKKILLAFDGSHFSEGAIEFANRLNKINPVLLTGAFLPQTDLANLWSYSGGGLVGHEFIPLVEPGDADIVQKNIKRFESYCASNEIEFRVHKDYFDFALPELKKETRFADLMIISSETFYKSAGTDEPNDYLKEALHGVECPVIVVPEKFEYPVNNILAYDGSESSVYAIKQFAYLLPELTGNETTLVYIKESEEGLPDESNIEELAARHYSHLTIFRFDADRKRYFNNWLLEKKGAILVSGAFGRSGFSRLFHKSFAANVIRDHQVPVFIAHK
ncbi:MAG: universal stress protein [Bacteroidota bacterium]|nr:universal stress protein [Bacteroidota bacterium]